MGTKRRDRLSMLEDAVKAITPAPVTDIGAQIALLEMIIPAEMAALLMLQRAVYSKKFTNRHVGAYQGARLKTADELRSEARQYEGARRALAQQLQELRDLTGDDDAAWQARGRRFEEECNRLAGVKGQAWQNNGAERAACWSPPTQKCADCSGWCRRCRPRRSMRPS
jgi:hypothetical protein